MNPLLLTRFATHALSAGLLLAATLPAGAQFKEIIWVDDDFPPGANSQVNADNHPHSWVTQGDGNHVFFGKKSLQRSGMGVAQDYFSTCDKPLLVCEGDKLFTHVFITPENSTRVVMLQFHTSGWHHRAFWGDGDAVPFGMPGTTQKVDMGPLPDAGKWVRLEIEASKLGIVPGMEITGMAFTICNGEVFFDKTGLATTGKEPPHGEKRDVVWLDDDFPAGAKAEVSGAPAQWVTAADGKVHAGKRALKRTGSGPTQDFFLGATEQLEVKGGDVLYAHVFIEPTDKPKAIMLQFNDGSWEHRAIWGDPAAIAWGNLNTASRRPLGPLPEAGKWIRLEVPANKVGLYSGAKLNGMAFTHEGGTVYWDKAGLSNAGMR
jgi:hypothetical protein